MLICASKCHDIPESRGLVSASSFRELMRPQKISLIRLPVLRLSSSLFHIALCKRNIYIKKKSQTKKQNSRGVDSLGPLIAFEMLNECPQSRARLKVSTQTTTWPGMHNISLRCISCEKETHTSPRWEKAGDRAGPGHSRPGSTRDASSPVVCPDSDEAFTSFGKRLCCQVPTLPGSYLLCLITGLRPPITPGVSHLGSFSWW